MSRRKPIASVRWTNLGEMCSGQGRIVNVTDAEVRFEIATNPEHPPARHRLAPGEFGLIAKSYTIRRAMMNGYVGLVDGPAETRASVIETLTNAAVLPVEDPRAVEFLSRRQA